jgi:serine protease AprX
VKIISSSLGYIDWYDTTQLDGQTAVITRAANAANALGIIVVNSAGNEGNNIRWRKVTPPADGDSVIAAGAVDVNGTIADFSSRGPTADGRIKPDFCALGVSDYVANYAGGYGRFSGTSFSAPLIAGGIALLLEGHPDWTLSRVISFVKKASSKLTNPNNAYGWGIPNFVDAYYMQVFSPSGNPEIAIIPHPAVDSAVCYLAITQAGPAVFSIHDLSGAEIEEWTFNVESPSTIIQVWDGRNHAHERVVSGIYICNLKIGDTSTRQKLFFISK